MEQWRYEHSECVSEGFVVRDLNVVLLERVRERP